MSHSRNDSRFPIRPRRGAEPKNKKTRLTPIFPEIRQILEELHPITGQSEYVMNVMRTKSKNWRTPLGKMMVKAGMQPWADPFNALRSSAATDIAKKHGTACEAEWLGHSPQIAMRHYVRATAEDFKKAANQESSFAPKVAPEPACIEVNGPELLPRLLPSGNPEKTAEHSKPNKKRASGEISLARSVDDIGLEPTTSTMSTWSPSSKTSGFIGFLIAPLP